MDFQLAEAAAERKVLLGGDVLVVKEEHFPVEERLADDADRRIAERRAQVDTTHDGADRRGLLPHDNLVCVAGVDSRDGLSVERGHLQRLIRCDV